MMIAFGFSSIFFAVLGLVVPVYGIFIAGLSGFLSWMSADKGTHLGTIAVIINSFNLFFLSPSYMLVVKMEEHLRDDDQTKTYTIWMFVLFIQITAVCVFLINIAMNKIDFNDLKGTFKKEKKNRNVTHTLDQPVENQQINSAFLNVDTNNFSNNIKAHISKNSSMTEIIPERKYETIVNQPKATIHNIHAGKKHLSDFFKKEGIKVQRDLEDIPLDKSKPHSKYFNRNKDLHRYYTVAVSGICMIFVIVILRPDLFSFLEYSNIYNGISKSFPGDNSDIPKNVQKPLPVQPRDIKPPPVDLRGLSEPLAYPAPIASSRNNTISNKVYWFIIKLKSGETIITQDAAITKNTVLVQGTDGQERRIDKSEVMSFERTKI